MSKHCYFLVSPLINSSRVLDMPFEENTGTITYDRSIYANNGTLLPIGSEPTWTTGKYGNALLFDGANDYVNIPYTSIFQLSGDFSIEFWVKANTITLYDGIIKQWSSSGSGFLCDWRNTTTIGCILYPSGVEKTVSTSGYGSLIIGVWYHITMTVTGTTSRIYVNSILAGATSGGGPTVTNTLPIVIGNSYTGGANLDGILDEVRIFNRALTLSEINASMNGRRFIKLKHQQ